MYIIIELKIKIVAQDMYIIINPFCQGAKFENG